MSFHCQLHHLYSEKAVQTECSMTVIPVSSGVLQSSCVVASSGTADLAINELLSRSGNAYSQSKTSGMATSSPSRASINGKTWLDYNHPSWDPRSVQRRVVSDPDSITRAPKTLHADSGRLRVVSLPEPTSLDSRVAIAKHQNHDVEKQSPCNREYPSDLPQTPSPPSSPDSVIIAGNETYVPSSFFQPHVEENGWTTWANSPPRPIPALHGPSSLPYARCPSGAEGTTIESGDLATKVWGLGSDEAHRLRLKSPQPLRSCVSSAPLPLDTDYQSVTSSALARHQDAVIDLVNPSTFYCYPGAYDSTGRRLVSFNGTYSSPSGHPGRPNLCAYTETPQDMHSETLTTTSIKNLPDRASAVGLGNGFAGRSQALSKTLLPTANSGQSNLNSAAPSFVPAYHTRDTDSERQNDFEYTHRASGLRQQHAPNLTPSSTASPLWSPVFQSVPTIVLGDYNPRIYSPQTDLDRSPNKFITPQMNSQDFITVQQRLRTEQDIKSIEPFYAQPYVANNAVWTTDTVSATHPSSLTEENRIESCERHLHLSHQQPRSIPMAPLMQRRLSSVVEENILTSYGLSKAHANTTSRRSSLVPGQSKVGIAEMSPGEVL